ncbi:MAG: lipoyl(octanoyl) transferase LipB [Chloroflexi bacterium]|nr:lipoyl(octanoyl) transferase LipB [Chloroflexota bacterium]
MALQRALVGQRQVDQVPDTLLLLEHPHVVTLGRRGKEADLLLPREELARLGMAVHEADRGGEVTYHGPGQLVGYVILHLRQWGGGPLRFVRTLEDVLIDVVGGFGVPAERVPGLTGVWVGDRKIAAIGVRVSGGVTSHGFALNVNTDLRYFDSIVPCGIRDKGVTSLAQELGREVDMAGVQEAVAAAFGRCFGREVR